MDAPDSQPGTSRKLETEQTQTAKVSTDAGNQTAAPAAPKKIPAAYAGLSTEHKDISELWNEMRDTVLEADKRKVSDAKEDLDTLLVFAGLFSAVVTTFVVDSYASLLPGDNDELAFLLRQSLAQNYTLVDGILRPVAPFPGNPPSFEPPLSALRINGLWFASLIVSLSTASFAMLVKQWLNEYLAMKCITPEEQLRTRQYRHSGLEDWKVFEIAATLPLLLHVSLGLFFIGLCFYTAAANELIGQSTFPLVVGWAFFALLTVVAPLASPRCPYNIALLKGALRAGRRFVSPVIRRLLSVPFTAAIALDTAAERAGVSWLSLPLQALRGATGTVESALETSLIWGSFEAFWILISLADIATLEFFWIAVLFTIVSPLTLILVLFFRHVGHFILSRVSPLLSADPHLIAQEEHNVLKRPLVIDEVLLSVDGAVVSDGPMLKTMAELLRWSEAPPPSVIASVLGCILHRTEYTSNDKRISSLHGHIGQLLDLRRLSLDAKNILLDLACTTLRPVLLERDVSPDTYSKPPDAWVADAAVILLSSAVSRGSADSVASSFIDPEFTCKMLQLARGLATSWPLPHVVKLVWAVLPRQMTLQPLDAWRLLPKLDEHGLSTAEVNVVIQTLLENTWRIQGDFFDAWTYRRVDPLPFVDSTRVIKYDTTVILPVVGEVLVALLIEGQTVETTMERVPQEEHSSPIVEATLMLLCLLNAPRPPLCQLDKERSFPGLDNATVEDAMATIFVEGKLEMAVRLARAFTESAYSIPVACPLNLYRVYIAGALLQRRALWEVLYALPDDTLHSEQLQLVILDLWRFLFECARLADCKSDDAHLQDDDFLKLCLVLARSRPPSPFGRDAPGWDHLVPVLRNAARRESRIADHSAYSQRKSIPGLAQHALTQFRTYSFDFPEAFIGVLEHLAVTPSAEGSVHLVIRLATAIKRAYLARFRGRRDSNGQRSALALEGGTTQAEPDAQPSPPDTSTSSAGAPSSAQLPVLATLTAAPDGDEPLSEAPQGTEHTPVDEAGTPSSGGVRRASGPKSGSSGI